MLVQLLIDIQAIRTYHFRELRGRDKVGWESCSTGALGYCVRFWLQFDLIPRLTRLYRGQEEYEVSSSLLAAIALTDKHHSDYDLYLMLNHTLSLLLSASTHRTL